MTYYVSSGTLNPTHSLTQSLSHPWCPGNRSFCFGIWRISDSSKSDSAVDKYESRLTDSLSRRHRGWSTFPSPSRWGSSEEERQPTMLAEERRPLKEDHPTVSDLCSPPRSGLAEWTGNELVPGNLGHGCGTSAVPTQQPHSHTNRFSDRFWNLHG